MPERTSAICGAAQAVFSATATFTSESASGWQQVDFASPVAISANTTYVASYFAPVGHYAYDSAYFASAGVDSGVLHALSTPAGGGNGVYVASPSGEFPVNSFNATNYWVDVVFSSYVVDNIPPTLSATSPATGPAGVASGVSVSAVITGSFSETVQASTIGFILKDAANHAVAGTTSFNSATQLLTFTPSISLGTFTTYTATVNGTDLAGDAIAPVSWSFTTGGLPTTWQQTTVTDFNAGSLNGVSVTNTSGGELQLASSLRDDFRGTTLGSTWTATSWERGRFRNRFRRASLYRRQGGPLQSGHSIHGS